MLTSLLLASVTGFFGSKHELVFDKKFLLVSTLLIVSTIADVESTLSCIDRGTCQEANPVTEIYINEGRPVVYTIQMSINLVILFFAGKMKSRGDKEWWIVPALVATGHGVFFTMNLRF